MMTDTRRVTTIDLNYPQLSHPEKQRGVQLPYLSVQRLFERHGGELISKSSEGSDTSVFP